MRFPAPTCKQALAAMLVLVPAVALAQDEKSDEGRREPELASASPQDTAQRRLTALGPQALFATLARGEAEAGTTSAEDVLAALGACDPSAVLAEIHAYLEASPTPRAWRAALQVLEFTGRATDVAFLVEAALQAGEGSASSRTADVFARSLGALLRREPAAHAYLARTWNTVSDELTGPALRAVCAAKHPDGADFVLATLRADPRRRDALLATITHLAPVARPATAARLADQARTIAKSGDASSLQAAILALGHLRDEDSMELLVGLMTTASPGVRKDSAWALRSITGLDLGTAPLWAMWLEDERRWLAQDAPRVLAAVTSARSADALAAIRDVSRHRLGRDRLGAKLAEALRHRDPAVRRMAADALGRSGARVALPALAEALDDSAAEVAAAAHAALIAITGWELSPRAGEWREAVSR